MYIRDLLKPKVAGGYTLRSDNQKLLQVPKTKCKSFRDRSILMKCLTFGTKYFNY